MPEQLSLDELFPQTKGQEINQPHVSDLGPNPEPLSITPPAEVAPSPVQPVSEPWREEMDGLKQMLAMVVQSQLRNQPQSQWQPTQPTPPAEDPYTFKPKPFITDEDTNLILTSGKPQEHLNRAFNKVAQEVYAPLAQELRKRDEAINQLAQQQQMRDAAIAQAARAQENQQKFFQAHADVAPLAYLVPHEARILAEEAQQNPQGFMGKSEKDIHALLATRVKERAQMIVQAANPQEGEQPVQRTTVPKGPSTFMERGSGVRPGAVKPPSDPSKRALLEMSNYMKNGKRSVA